MTHRRLPALRRILTLGLLAPAGLGFSATQAHASGETLSIVQNDPTAVAGHATNFTASGTLNPDDTMFGFDIFVFLKDADRDPTCAPDFDTESAAAMHSGGNESWVSPAGGFQVGAGPAFNQPFKITFTGRGNYLLCGYVKGDFSTFASAQLRGVVAPDPTLPTPPVTTTPPSSTTTPTASVPVATHAPWITRKGHVLTCHPGSWSNTPTSLSYRWYVTGRRKNVAAGPKLKVHRSLAGRIVACRVTAQNAAGSKTASSRSMRAR
jgi:hypothetical protein